MEAHQRPNNPPATDQTEATNGNEGTAIVPPQQSWQSHQVVLQLLEELLQIFWKAQHEHIQFSTAVLRGLFRYYNELPLEVGHEGLATGQMKLLMCKAEPQSDPHYNTQKALVRNRIAMKKQAFQGKFPPQKKTVGGTGEVGNAETKKVGSKRTEQPDTPSTFVHAKHPKQRLLKKERTPSQSLIRLETHHESESPIIEEFRERLTYHLKTQYETRQHQLDSIFTSQCRANMFRPTAFTYGYRTEKIVLVPAKPAALFNDIPKGSIMEINPICPAVIRNKFESSLPCIISDERQHKKGSLTKGQIPPFEQENSLMSQLKQPAAASASALKSILDRIAQVPSRPAHFLKPLRR